MFYLYSSRVLRLFKQKTQLNYHDIPAGCRDPLF
uniref:Uncharacterized protein n=1 Tax=Anguilla anguilla TaxID=7936 RepID=A0A0E9URX3_ANGAN